MKNCIFSTLFVFSFASSTLGEDINSLREKGVRAIRFYKDGGEVQYLGVNLDSITLEQVAKFELPSDTYSGTVYLNSTDNKGVLFGSVLSANGRIGIGNWYESGALKTLKLLPHRNDNDAETEVATEIQSLYALLKFLAKVSHPGIRIDVVNGKKVIIPFGKNISLDEAQREILDKVLLPEKTVSATLLLNVKPNSDNSVFGVVIDRSGAFHEVNWDFNSGQVTYLRDIDISIAEKDPEYIVATFKGRNSFLFKEETMQAIRENDKITLWFLGLFFAFVIPAGLIFLVLLYIAENKTAVTIVDAAKQKLQWPMEWVRNLKHN